MGNGELKQCPYCPVKGFGEYMEKHIYRCGHKIPLTQKKEKQSVQEKTTTT